MSLRTALRTHQLLESRLVDVTLQCEVTQDFPRRLVTLHLHLVCLQTTVVSLWTGRHHWSPRHPLDVLQMTTNHLFAVINRVQRPHYRNCPSQVLRSKNLDVLNETITEIAMVILR